MSQLITHKVLRRDGKDGEDFIVSVAEDLPVRAADVQPHSRVSRRHPSDAHRGPHRPLPTYLAGLCSLV